MLTEDSPLPEYFDVRSASGGYRVHVGTGFINDTALVNKSAIFLIDERLRSVLPAAAKNVIAIAATEDNKSLEQAAPVIKALRDLGANRKSEIVAIGGGIIQDIATFVASIYMRGLPWKYLPTTLLGMVDSCIGGKSSINVAGYKNLVGNFYPPKEILVDLEFIRTLNAEQIAAGLCEAVKICYAHSDKQFSGYLKASPLFDLSINTAENVVVRSLRCKQWFIEKDEYDQKERLLLNFGHTFGHAIEAATNFAVSHGIAVGVGMMVAEEFAHKNNLLNETGKQRTKKLSDYVFTLLAAVPALARELQAVEINKILEKFESDKKHLPDAFRVVLPTSDGHLELMSIEKTPTVKSAISDAYRAAFTHVST